MPVYVMAKAVQMGADSDQLRSEPEHLPCGGIAVLVAGAMRMETVDRKVLATPPLKVSDLAGFVSNQSPQGINRRHRHRLVQLEAMVGHDVAQRLGQKDAVESLRVAPAPCRQVGQGRSVK